MWLWPKAGPLWKEPNSLPNPELLPGFLSWKPFLMGTPLSCGKSNSSSKSQGSMLSPLQLDQLYCPPLLHSRYFSLNSPSRVLWLALSEPFWAGSDLGQLGSGTLCCGALAKPRCGPLTTSTPLRCQGLAFCQPGGRQKCPSSDGFSWCLPSLRPSRTRVTNLPALTRFPSPNPLATACNASFGPTASAGSSLVVP